MIENHQQLFSLKYQIFAIISILFFVTVICLFVERFMLHQEIMDASNQCFRANGMPMVEKESLFSGNYSFSCEKIN